MKKITNLRWLIMSLLLAVSVGSAWGDTYSLTPNQTNTGSNATSYITTLTEFTYSGISWKMNQWNPSTLQIKTNQSSATNEFRFYNTTAFEGRITQVVIKFSSLTVSDATKLMFVGGTSQVTATSGGTAGTWNSTAKTLTWTPSASENFTYFAFYQNGKAASGSNYLASSDAIVVTYDSSSGTSTATVNIDKTALVIGETATVSTDGPAVSLTTSDASVASVSGTTVTAEGTGNATITASWSAGTVGGTTYSAGTKNFSITVTAPFVITDGYFDFSKSNYGSGLSTSDEYVTEDHTWTAVNITLVSHGNYRYYMPTSGNPDLRFYSGGSFTLSAPNGYVITHIEMTGNKLTSLSGNIGNYYPESASSTWTGNSQSVIFSRTGNDNVTIQTISVTYEATVVKTLTSIAISGTPATFYVGDTFNSTGMTVTATYSDNTTQDVTNSADFSAPDMSTSGTKTVTVSYTEGGVTKTSSYDIVVSPQPTYTVTLADDNTTLTEASYQTGVTLPSRSAVGYTFLGWTLSDILTETTTVPETIIPVGAYQPAENITLYPVYRRIDGEGSSSTTSNVTISDYAADNNWSNGTQYPTIEIDENITATASGGGNDGKYYSSGSNWRFYQNSSGKLTISASEGNTLQSVKITYTIENTGTFLYGGDTYTSGTELSVTGSSVEFTVGNTGEATNGQVRVTAISVTYSNGSSTTYYTSHPVQTPSISFAEATAEVNIGANYTQPATPSNVEGLTYSIAYSSDNECATVNNNGVVTGVSEGTAIITATMTIGSDTYTATYTIIVNDPNKPGTVNNPYTVAQALDIIDPLANNGKTDWVYVTGTISSITEVSTQYGNATYLIKDDEDNTLTIYRGKYLNNKDFTSGSQIAVGDVVVVYGQLQKYVKNNETTPEVAQGNYLVSLLHTGSDVPAPVFDPVDESSFSEPYTVTISAEAGLTIYYISQDNKIFKTAAGGRTPNYAESNGELVSAAVAYSGALTFGQSMMVTAICMDANGNFSDPVTVKYTYTGSVVPPYYSSFSASEGDFTDSNETSVAGFEAPFWKMNSNTGADAIARWGEERYYMYVRGTSGNTTENRTRWYGSAYLTSPIIDLTGKANASFSFIHAAHHFYSDPNDTPNSSDGTNKTSSLEQHLDDTKVSQACKVQVGICDASGNVSTWTDIASDDINWPEQLFDPSKTGVSADGKSTTNTSSRSGLFPRANSGDISLASYNNQKIRIRFAYTSTPSNYGTWNIDQITVNAINVEEMTMNSRGWTTYVFDHDIDAYTTTQNYISGGEETLKIYKVTEFDKETCVLQQLGKFEEYSTSNNSERYIPAKTPVVIQGPAGATIDFVEYSAPEMLPTVKNNLLIASLAPNTAKAPVGSGIRYFVLQWNNSTNAPWFNKVSEGREIPDHRAYLNGTDQMDHVTAQSNSVKGIYVLGEEEEEATGIVNVENVVNTKDNQFYNLAGQRVMNPTKGIYIVNGKKVFIK